MTLETLSAAFGGLLMAGLMLTAAGLLVTLIAYRRQWLLTDTNRHQTAAARMERDELGHYIETIHRQLDAMPDWLLRVDHGGKVIQSNRPRQTRFDNAGEDNDGQPLSGVVPLSISQTIVDALAQVAENGRPYAFEFSFQDGASYGEARLLPIDAHQVLVLLRDRTTERTRQSRLQQSKARFALAIEGANDGLWDWNLDTNEVYYSYAWKTLLAYGSDDIQARPDAWLNLVHPEDAQSVQAAIDAHLQGRTNRFESEHRLRTADNRWLWVLARGMVQRNAEGIPTRMAGSLTDLTNRRVVQVTQEKASLLEHATSSVHIGIAVYHGKGLPLSRVSHVLQQMCSSWSSVDAWWGEVRAAILAPPQHVCPVCHGKQYVGTVLASCTDDSGEPYFFEIAFTGHAHEVSDEGTAHVLLVKDVTQRTVAERRLRALNDELVIARDAALAASQAKSTFLANMSHELRTPLNHIIGYAEMVAEELEETDLAECAEDIAKIETSGRHLLHMVQGILEYTQVERDDMGLSVHSHDVYDLVERGLSDASSQLQSSGNQVQFQRNTAISVETDGEKVLQILAILLDNAAKFCRDGQVTVAVTHQDGTVSISVADTGIGMTENQRKNLFAAFYQADQSYSRDYDGVGLSLALGSRLAALLQGTIQVESAVGIGSTFTLTLPVHSSPVRGTAPMASA